jgi:hypothetical protein
MTKQEIGDEELMTKDAGDFTRGLESSHPSK